MEGETFQPQLTIAERLIEPGKETKENNPFGLSTAAKKLRERKKNLPLRIAFFDIDSTITGDPNKVNTIRDELEKKGFVVCYVTSRTEEMIMSDEQRKRSSSFNRQPAKLGKNPETKKREIVDPQSVEPEGIIDPDIIAGSTGTSIWIKQETGGYLKDAQFETRLKTESQAWRDWVMKLRDYINQTRGVICEALPIENSQNYEGGLTDVYPPNFRVQLTFKDLEAKQTFIKIIKEIKLANSSDKIKLPANGIDQSILENILNLRITDDSNPDKNRFSVYLTPLKGYKTRAVEQVVNQLTQLLQINRKDLEVLIAGDSFPDLGMGLYGGLETNATFLIVNQSRLAKGLTTESTQSFAGEGISAIKRRLALIPENKGWYIFKIPNPNAESQPRTRTVIIGDEAFPGISNQDSILKILDTIYN
jgi:hydroxymethylpyrimidine pyrophosphatase-like HAD family hydrolase